MPCYTGSQSPDITVEMSRDNEILRADSQETVSKNQDAFMM